ncbi:MAG: family 43 glycosylhydrolase [Thermogutta sp.]
MHRSLHILMGLLFATNACAQPTDSHPIYTPMTPEQHQATFSYTSVKPLLDVPMIDPAITRGPDGVYYLTGTTGTRRKDGTVDFAVNDGIRLWRSNDLKTWDDLGLVAPLSLLRAQVADLTLLRTAQFENEFKGFIAPELHFIKSEVYLTYALSPSGTGLLKSKTGKPEGPYEDVGLITKNGTDASLFMDDDGTVYWVFGGGWIAKMNATMTALAEPPRLIQPNDTRQGLTPGGQVLQVGTGGAFLFKKDGTYHLLAAGIHGRLGVPCYDTWVITAKSLAGPWSRRKLAVPHGGQSTMFPGPGGQWYATFSGVDSRAAVRERAAIVPVDWVEHVAYWGSPGEPWPWKRPQVITEAWGWEHARPISNLQFRDPVAVNGGDGYFYATGLHIYRSHGRNICILKGQDLNGKTPWERIPLAGFQTVDDVPWFTSPDKAGSFFTQMCKIFRAKDTFWITLVFVSGGGRVLRSESGTMNGPWKVAVPPPDKEPPNRGYWRSIPCEDFQGRLYGRLDNLLWPMTADFSALDKRVPPTESGYQQQFDTRLSAYLWESVDGSALIRGDVPAGHVYRVDGKYLMIGGAGWHGDYRSFGTYDSEVFWANEIGGPWHPNRTVLPHGGNSGIFQDDAGGWWHISFANDNFLPDMSLLRCLPLEIKWNGHGYDIGPKHKQDNPYIHRPPRLVLTGPTPPPVYPVVKLPPDILLQDPAITLGDAGIYYLTGTVGTDGDFRNNDGVYLWRSTDLAKWEAVGRVASLGRGKENLGKGTGFGPINYFFSPPDSLEPRYDRGIIAPKLYQIGNDWWIVFSLSRQKIGLLKSTTGKPEGPYELWGPDAGHKTTGFLADTGLGVENNTDAYLFAYDPSLFVEEDTVYCVFGPGWIAPLTQDMKAFAERPRLLRVEDRRAGPGGQPLYPGKGGCQVFNRNGLYHLWSTTEWGDTVEYTADSLYGPYGNPRLILAQSGNVGIFQSENGELTAVVGHWSR